MKINPTLVVTEMKKTDCRDVMVLSCLGFAYYLMIFVFIYRDQEKQEALWQYSIDCLKEFLKPEDLNFLNKG